MLAGVVAWRKVEVLRHQTVVLFIQRDETQCGV